jgi:hypothetical protein
LAGSHENAWLPKSIAVMVHASRVKAIVRGEVIGVLPGEGVYAISALLPPHSA